MAKFTETQAFATFVYVLIGSSVAPCLYAVAITYRKLGLDLMWPVVPLGLALNLLCQKTLVTERDLIVTFGAVLPLYRKQFALPEIASAKAVTYSPLNDYGGWGIRGWGKNIALNSRGNRGVRLTLQDGSRVLVGSQRPEELAQALGTER